ncbi:hypothetical protein CbC4_1712 [Clostridium botulinum BKT015925]|nr:hypothetical protein CbC4_1712 [Clostridium botulinum BKT015925]
MDIILLILKTTPIKSNTIIVEIIKALFLILWLYVNLKTFKKFFILFT